MLVAISCANPVSPKGGEKDETAQLVNWETSSPNLQTQFEDKIITLNFDEFVILKDQLNQIVVSPPLEKRLKSQAKKKTIVLTIDSDETLKTNTTYTINMGNAIQDFTEGNSAENLRFVFSTGAFIDSSSVTVRTVDALTRVPIADAVVMLFDPTNDSAAIKGIPYYFGKTNKSGELQLDYLRAGRFQLIGLTDANSNYIYDDPSEQLGFSDTLIVTTPNSKSYELKLFQETPVPEITECTRPYPGAYFFTVLGDPHLLDLQTFDSQEVTCISDRDTLKCWADTALIIDQMIFSLDDDLRDTQRVEKIEILIDHIPSLVNKEDQKNQRIVTYPNRLVQLNFNMPVDSVDMSKVVFIDTGGQINSFSSDIETQIAGQQLSINGLDKYNSSTRLMLLPNAVHHKYVSLLDTAIIDIQHKTAAQLSNLHVTVNGLDSLEAYGLILKRDQSVVEQKKLSNQTSLKWQIPSLEPKTYELWLYLDKNRNGRFDTGKFEMRIQNEPVVIKSISNLRPNWDIELSINPDKTFE
jgi:hypothetical protein